MIGIITTLGPSLAYVVLGCLVPGSWSGISKVAARLLYFVCIPLVVFRTAFLSDVTSILLIAALSFLISCLSSVISLFVHSSLYPRPTKAVMFGYYNIGWFGIPVAQVLFGEVGMAVMAAAYIGGVLFGATAGVYFIAAAQYRPTQSLVKMLQTPALHALWLGFLAKNWLNEQVLDFAIFDLARLLLSVLGMALIGTSIRRYGLSLDAPKKLVAFLALRIGVAVVAVSSLIAISYSLMLIDKETAQILLMISAFPIAANIIVISESLGSDTSSYVAALAGSTILSFLIIALVYIGVDIIPIYLQ